MKKKIFIPSDFILIENVSSETFFEGGASLVVQW